MDNEDIDEIIYHIQKLKKLNFEDSAPKTISKEKKSEDTSENQKNKQKRTGKVNSISEINNENIMNELSNLEDIQPVYIMDPEIIGLTDDSMVTCDVCEKDMVLGKNLSGLVVSNEFFACEHCCQNLSKEELLEWTKSKMIATNDVRPIGLWVIQQQGENKKKNSL